MDMYAEHLEDYELVFHAMGFTIIRAPLAPQYDFLRRQKVLVIEEHLSEQDTLRAYEICYRHLLAISPSAKYGRSVPDECCK